MKKHCILGSAMLIAQSGYFKVAYKCFTKF